MKALHYYIVYTWIEISIDAVDIHRIFLSLRTQVHPRIVRFSER